MRNPSWTQEEKGKPFPTLACHKSTFPPVRSRAFLADSPDLATI
ncbi:hypothetical protein TNCV_3445391 [Trichonephila clavipes]|nr:hypothetical protein TNCV_3445391 [Trichonephila clavipes]